MIPAFVSDMQSRNLSPESIRSYAYILRQFERTNRVVFFDDEAAEYLRRYLKVRAFRLKDPENRQLWLGNKGNLKKGGLDNLLRKAAIRAGLHDSESPDMERHFSAHCARHFYTTMLDRAGMARRHIQVLRGDVGGEAIDIYLHNDLEEIRGFASKVDSATKV